MNGPGNTSGTGGSSPSGSGGSGNGGSNVETGTGGGGPATGSGGMTGGGSGGTMIIDTPDGGGTDASTMVMKMSCTDTTYSDKFTPGYPMAAQMAAEAAAKTAMTGWQTADKANQMRGTPEGNSEIFQQYDDTNHQIKGFKFRDGPRGVCLEADPVGNSYSTAFPVAAARAASFDLELEYEVGDAIGDETLTSGHTMLLSPTVNILRHPFWGRAQEVYGEDDYTQGRFGSAFTAGLQQYVAACAKHYAANNIENGRASDTSKMDDQTLHELYANHFGMIIQDGGVACLMASYNLLSITDGAGMKEGNIHATQSAHLLTDIARNEFGFKGFVLSDWWAMPGGQSPAQGQRPTLAQQAVQAGLDMELPNALNFNTLESDVSGGLLKETDVDTAALRIMAQKFRFKVASTNGPWGLKTPTTKYTNGSITNDATHLALAQKAAEESMVLLKNDNNTLPINKDTVKTIAVLGLTVPYTLGTEGNGSVNFATDVRTGDRGSSRVKHDPAKAMGPAAGIMAAAGVAGTGIKVVTGNSAAAAMNADFVVVMVGLTPQDEGEEYTGAGDRGTFNLNGKSGTDQNGLITAAANLKKPMVVVVEAGAVVDLPALTNPNVGAVVMAWYPGMLGGAALGRLLFNQVNFSGKLPVTWDSKNADWPTFNGGGTTTMDYYLGYQWFDHNKTPAANYLPFGYGLSYSKFTYSNLQVTCSDVTQKGVVPVTVDVTNTSNVDGDEIVFLFTSYMSPKARHHDKDLKAFARVAIPAGKTARVPLSLRVSDLKYWDTQMGKWIVETGPVQIAVGPNSANLMLKDTVTIK